jgi:hypothetical protein
MARLMVAELPQVALGQGPSIAMEYAVPNFDHVTGHAQNALDQQSTLLAGMDEEDDVSQA